MRTLHSRRGFSIPEMALATVFGSLLLLAAVVWVFALVTASKVTIAETAVETKVEQVLEIGRASCRERV